MSTPNEKLRLTAHFETEVLGFQVADYTTPNRANTEELDLIWVGCHSEGAWLTLDQARYLAASITFAADCQAKRLAGKAPS